MLPVSWSSHPLQPGIHKRGSLFSLRGAPDATTPMQRVSKLKQFVLPSPEHAAPKRQSLGLRLCRHITPYLHAYAMSNRSASLASPLPLLPGSATMTSISAAARPSSSIVKNRFTSPAWQVGRQQEGWKSLQQVGNLACAPPVQCLDAIDAGLCGLNRLTVLKNR